MRVSASTLRSAFAAGRELTRTLPAMMRRWAPSRLSARPRRVISRSSRVRIQVEDRIKVKRGERGIPIFGRGRSRTSRRILIARSASKLRYRMREAAASLRSKRDVVFVVDAVLVARFCGRQRRGKGFLARGILAARGRRRTLLVEALIRRGLQIALRVAAEHLDLLFDLVELLIERAHQGDAALEGTAGIFEGEFAGIDLADDLFEVF